MYFITLQTVIWKQWNCDEHLRANLVPNTILQQRDPFEMTCFRARAEDDPRSSCSATKKRRAQNSSRQECQGNGGPMRALLMGCTGRGQNSSATPPSLDSSRNPAHRSTGRPLCTVSTLDNIKLCHCAGIFFQSMRTANTQPQIKRGIHKLVHVQREKTTIQAHINQFNLINSWALNRHHKNHEWKSEDELK